MITRQNNLVTSLNYFEIISKHFKKFFIDFLLTHHNMSAFENNFKKSISEQLNKKSILLITDNLGIINSFSPFDFANNQINFIFKHAIFHIHTILN